MTTKDQLELIVDRIGLKNAVELLAIICEEKAEHISSNWQDEILSKDWTRSARALDKSAGRIEV
jgi:hypothetical protein